MSGLNREIAPMMADELKRYMPDLVDVVRCKDCKYWHREIHDGIEYFNFSSCDLNHCGDGHNFYCADGARMEGEEG